MSASDKHYTNKNAEEGDDDDEDSDEDYQPEKESESDHDDDELNKYLFSWRVFFTFYFGCFDFVMLHRCFFVV